MRKLSSDWVEAYFNHGVDVANRRVWLVGDFSEKTIRSAVKGIYLLDTINQTPIEVFVSSNGGDPPEMFAIYDVMQTIKSDIETFALGKCCSCAPLLVAAGLKGRRFLAPHVEFMLHDFTVQEVDGKLADADAYIEATRSMQAEFARLMAIHSAKPESFWKGLMRKRSDYYFSADNAMEWGIADCVWDEKS